MEGFLQAPHFCDQKVDKRMQEQGMLGEVCVPCLRSSKCQLSSKWHGKWTWRVGPIPHWLERHARLHGVAIGICLWLSLSYITCAVLCGECVTYPVLSYVGNMSYTPWAILCGKCVWIAFCVRSMSYTRSAILCGEFLFHAGSFLNAPCCFKWGASLTHPILFYVWIFSDTPRCFKWGVSFLIVCPVFFRVNSFFYTPQAVLCRSFLLQFYVPGTSLSGEFLLHTPC